jgi:Ser/Thr protein kinase RdoA (MazF antagonist)
VKIYTHRQCWTYSDQHYLFELELQLFLAQKNFPVPEPILNLRGELLETIMLPEGQKYLAVYKYVPGKKWDHRLSKQNRLVKLGAQVARLHQLTTQYPKVFQTRKLDITQLVEKSWKSIDQEVTLPSEEIKIKVRSMYEEIKCLVTSQHLEIQPLRLIHGDVHAGNHLYDAETDVLYILDFELCGYGYLGYEAATLKWDLLNSHKKIFVERCMDAFFSGYSHITPVAQTLLDTLDTFVKVRHFFMLGSSFLFYPDRPHLNSEFMLNYYIKMFYKFS